MAKSSRSRSQKSRLKTKPSVVWSTADQALLDDALRLHQSGELRAAEQRYKKLLKSFPDHLAVNDGLGIVFHQLGENGRAARYLKKAAELSNGDPAYLNKYGFVLWRASELSAAKSVFEELVEKRPDFIQGHINLGNVLLDLKLNEKALLAFDEALAIDDKNLEAWNNSARAAKNLCLTEDANDRYQKALALQPTNPQIISNYLFSLNYLSSLSPKALFDAHHLAGQSAPALQSFSNGRGVKEGDLIRVGFVSADFNSHSVAYFFEPLLDHIDHNKFKVFAYYNQAKRDQVTERIEAKVAEFRQISTMSTQAFSQRIMQDEIDILVDLGGHTLHNRMDVFGQRVAPVQVTWLGYPNTTGLPNVDFRIIDSITDPDGYEEFCTERLLRLENGFLCYAGDQSLPFFPELPYDKEGHFTFGSFNNLLKVNEEVIAVWAEILTRVEHSRILLKAGSLDQASVKERIFSWFEKYGVDRKRVDLLGRIRSQSEHMALYSKVDLCLDPFPYNGTTTTCEALWMGVPTVCSEGDRHAARVGASILKHCDLDIFVAENLDQYKSLATEMATSREKLRSLRPNLRANMMASQLCDGERFAKNMMAAFSSMLADSTA